jgi:hypothetical protein
VGALVAVSFTLWPRTKSPQFYFAVSMRAATAGFAQLYYGIGSGANEAHSSRLFVEGGNREGHYQFSLPEGRYLNLRFDPTDQAANTITLSRTRIVKHSGKLVRASEPRELGRFGYYAQGAVSNGKNVLIFSLAISTLLIVNTLAGLFRLSPSPKSDERHSRQNP